MDETTIKVLTLPRTELDIRTTCLGTVYSNYERNFKAIDWDQGGYAQHAAWDYCGWVWRTEGGWIETVMVYGEVVATYGCADLPTLIDHVIDEHGAD